MPRTRSPARLDDPDGDSAPLVIAKLGAFLVSEPFMSDTPDSLHFEEYRALRSTIRERGSLRVIVIAITFSAWAGALLAASALFTIPLFSLVPLTVLAAGFETVFALHVAIERIGRYIHAHYEPLSATTAGWEHAMTAFAASSGGVNPLFPAVFIAATLINLALGTLTSLDAGGDALARNPWEMLPYAALHAGFIIRVVMAGRFASGQRAADLREFERLRTPRRPDPIL